MFRVIELEVWVDSATKRIMAIYDPGRYTGKEWQRLGYERYSRIEPWMLPHENPPPPPPEPTELLGEDGKTYTIKNGVLVAKEVSS